MQVFIRRTLLLSLIESVKYIENSKFVILRKSNFKLLLFNDIKMIIYEKISNVSIIKKIFKNGDFL